MSTIPNTAEEPVNTDILAFLDAKFSNVKQGKKRKKNPLKQPKAEDEPQIAQSKV